MFEHLTESKEPSSFMARLEQVTSNFTAILILVVVTLLWKAVLAGACFVVWNYLICGPFHIDAKMTTGYVVTLWGILSVIGLVRLAQRSMGVTI